MPTGPNRWKTPAEARARAEELRTVLDQYARKEISLKDVLHILRPEIEGIVERMQEAANDENTPPAGTLQEQAGAFSESRLKREGQVFAMLRACLNDAEQAAGMWEQQKKKK